MKFKTNIRCDGCVAKVTPGLNETAGANNWSVDLQNPDRILHVNKEMNSTQIQEALIKSGYQGTLIEQ